MNYHGQAFYNSLPMNNEPIQVYQGQALPSFQSISPQVRMPLQYQSAQVQQQIRPSMQYQTQHELPGMTRPQLQMPMTRSPLQRFSQYQRTQYCPSMNQGQATPQVVPHRPAWQVHPALPQVPVRPIEIERRDPPALPQVPVRPIQIESRSIPNLPQVPVQPIKLESQEDENEIIESMFNEIVNEVHRIEEEQNLPKIHFDIKPGEANPNEDNCRLM